MQAKHGLAGVLKLRVQTTLAVAGVVRQPQLPPHHRHVLQRVQRMLHVRRSWAQRPHHHRPVALLREHIPQGIRELRPTERHVLLLPSCALRGGVHGEHPHALLQVGEGEVDGTAALGHGAGVLGGLVVPLGPGQVHDAQAAAAGAADLDDTMRPRALLIPLRALAGTLVECTAEHTHEVLLGFHRNGLRPAHVDLLVCSLEELDLSSLLIQQVIYFFPTSPSSHHLDRRHSQRRRRLPLLLHLLLPLGVRPLHSHKLRLHRILRRPHLLRRVRRRRLPGPRPSRLFRRRRRLRSGCRQRPSELPAGEQGSRGMLLHLPGGVRLSRPGLPEKEDRGGAPLEEGVDHGVRHGGHDRGRGARGGKYPVHSKPAVHHVQRPPVPVYMTIMHHATLILLLHGQRLVLLVLALRLEQGPQADHHPGSNPVLVDRGQVGAAHHAVPCQLGDLRRPQELQHQDLRRVGQAGKIPELSLCQHPDVQLRCPKVLAASQEGIAELHAGRSGTHALVVGAHGGKYN
mmetsp:Transcript_59721/g.159823  ORF Transcript_59721/g.159823 Transcript_59721/m.159823 type:complete len:515 (-) Transcript_59721:8-1552(-)